MENKKQSSVDWLIEQTRSPEWHSLKRGEIFKKAKEMHKEEIENTWFDSTMQFANESEMPNKKLFEEYYNETFIQ